MAGGENRKISGRQRPSTAVNQPHARPQWSRRLWRSYRHHWPISGPNLHTRRWVSWTSIERVSLQPTWCSWWDVWTVETFLFVQWLVERLRWSLLAAPLGRSTIAATRSKFPGEKCAQTGQISHHFNQHTMNILIGPVKMTKMTSFGRHLHKSLRLRRRRACPLTAGTWGTARLCHCCLVGPQAVHWAGLTFSLSRWKKRKKFNQQFVHFIHYGPTSQQKLSHFFVQSLRFPWLRQIKVCQCPCHAIGLSKCVSCKNNCCKSQNAGNFWNFKQKEINSPPKRIKRNNLDLKRKLSSFSN